MEGLYQNKFRIKSFRLENYNYSQVGYYFVTICTEQRKMFFGNVRDSKMILNDIGKIADRFLCDIPEHFRRVQIDKYIVMPNHIHAIIVIKDNDVGGDNFGRDEALPRLYDGEYPQMSKISPKPGSIPVIIGAYKSICTKIINKKFLLNFQWQNGYYDHIIRGEKDYENIWQYIDINPDKWEWDKNNPKNFR